MKTLLTLTLYCFILLTNVHGQNISFQVEGGTNLTHLSSFKNRVFIIDQGLAVPGILNLTNGNLPPIVSVSNMSTSVEPGFFMNVEAFYYKAKNNNWEFSSSLGFDLWKFNYDNAISREETIFFNISYYDMYEDNMWERLNAVESESLSQLSGTYGEVQTLYIELQPFNVSRHFFKGQVSIQTGPIISMVLDSKGYESIAIKYNNGSEHTWEEIDDVYFSFMAYKQFLPGWSFGLQGKIFDKVSVFVATKYYFAPSIYFFSSPLKYRVFEYDNHGEIVDFEDKVVDNQGPLPLQFQAGLSFDVWKIKKEK